MIAKKLQDKFFTDPDWSHVENTLLEYITPLLDIRNIDLKVPAEELKAEVIARITTFERLDKFLNDTKVVSRPLTEGKNIFR